MTQTRLNDPGLCNKLIRNITEILDGRPMRFMEVCGTHTVSIFQSGLRSLLPENIIHISGPGCPVCVTHDSEIVMLLEAARKEKTILATFGDLLRVPGPDGYSLKKARAAGANIKIVYSPLEALQLARENPEHEIVFPGIGFETTAPAIAAAIKIASRENLSNFSVLSFHKLVPPAIESIVADSSCNVDAFLLPGHVATITGLTPFTFLAQKYRKPAAVGGFEAGDILLALRAMALGLTKGKPEIVNAYPRAVDEQGNPKALALLNEIFETSNAQWRGLGNITHSGLKLRPAYSHYDTTIKLNLSAPEELPVTACRCGDVLKGKLIPSKCPLFGRKCTPASPVGPCMVSTEGSCAAHFKYGEHEA